MSKFNSKKNDNKTTNLAGGVSYSRSPKMELVVSVLNTFLEDKYYESAEERMERLRNLIDDVEDEFVAKLACKARGDFHLRSVSHLLVGELSKVHKGDSLVRNTIYEIAYRPDDLAEIVAYVGEPIPNQIKKGVADALTKFDEYQLKKYKMENKEVSLVDLFNISHPDPSKVSDDVAEAWEKLINDNLGAAETWEAKKSKEDKDPSEVWRELIEEGRESYFALLRNLRNIADEADPDIQQKVRDIITDKERVKSSKVLPFRFYTAYQAVDDNDMLNAISEAMDHSVDNVPEFGGDTLVALDCSGSMTGGYNPTGATPIQKGAIFAAALFKRNDATLRLYDTKTYPISLLKEDPILTIVQKIENRAQAGGTDTSSVFNKAKRDKEEWDRIVIISDNESWAHNTGWGGSGTTVQDAHQEYKEVVGVQPFIYAIDIQGYGTTDIKDPRTFHLAGWSSQLFEFMSKVEKEDQLVEEIEKINI